MEHQVELTVNGTSHRVVVDSGETLATVLRERLKLTGTKIGCDSGACGACAVLINGRLRNSCVTFAQLLHGANVCTIEGVSNGNVLHPVQKALVENGAIQCGFCSPGIVMAAVSLLNENPNPTDKEIREAISGNICRCTGYTKILKAIKEASGSVAEQGA